MPQHHAATPCRKLCQNIMQEHHARTSCRNPRQASARQYQDSVEPHSTSVSSLLCRPNLTHPSISRALVAARCAFLEWSFRRKDRFTEGARSHLVLLSVRTAHPPSP
eukprot:5941440-Pleurochrysis_carterae.AAC.3